MIAAARNLVSVSGASNNGSTYGTTAREPSASNASSTYRVSSWFASFKVVAQRLDNRILLRLAVRR